MDPPDGSGPITQLDVDHQNEIFFYTSDHPKNNQIIDI